MKLTKDYIINHIRATGYPCWSLFVIQNYKKTPIMHYNGDDFAQDDDAAAKVEKSIARLTNALASLPMDALLAIELRSSKGANGTQGTLGAFEFYNHDKADEVPGTSAQSPTTASFAGFMQPPSGWITEEALAGKLEQVEARSENRIRNILLQQKEKEFREWAKRERAAIEQLRKEVKDEKKKYESNTGAAAETLVFAIKKLLAELFPASPIAGALAGTGTPPAEISNEAAAMDGTATNDPERSGKYKAVEGLASMLYEDSRVTEGDVAKIQALIQAQLDKNQNQSGEEDAENA